MKVAGPRVARLIAPLQSAKKFALKLRESWENSWPIPIALDAARRMEDDRGTMTQPPRAQRMERVIRTYIQACNDADAVAIAACLHPQAAHYFPPGRTSWLGAVTIGGNIANAVREQGFRFTVDQLLSDVDRHASTMEWTRIDRQGHRLVRGVDWFVFERQTFSIREIRCYYASPLDADLPRQELIDFDYAALGYPTT
jgi:hypothetical protein